MNKPHRISCRILFDGTLSQTESFVSELYKRKVVSKGCILTQSWLGKQAIEFIARNPHSILRAYAVCEDMRVQLNLKQIRFSSPEGITYFRSHAR